jgi:hypothetical protein
MPGTNGVGVVLVAVALVGAEVAGVADVAMSDVDGAVEAVGEVMVEASGKAVGEGEEAGDEAGE